MTATQIGVNDRALCNAAAKVESIGYTGDAHRFVESLVLSVLADGYRRIEAPPALQGPGASREAIDDALRAAGVAVRAAKDGRKKGSGS